MAGLARKALAALPNCGVDAEDAAQGAFVSFWRALDGGRGFEFANRNDLWKLLGIMTTRKARKMARRQLAKKRGGGRIRLETDLRGAATEQMPVDSPLDSGSAEIRPAEFDLCCEEMLLALDDEHRTTAILRLQGYSSQEIASRLNCSPRSIQRKLQVIRGAWERMALAE
jgi:DNA-directed RNA polymerase specialized sigma24 family protein